MQQYGQFFLLNRIGYFHRMNHQKCFFISQNISSYLFAKFFRISKTIQVIILHLESYTQIFAKLKKMLTVTYTCTSHNRPHLQTGCQQYRCFKGNHIHIFIQTHLLPLFKIHIQLLTFTYFLGRFIKQRHDTMKMTATNFIQVFICCHQHYIPCKQSGTLAIIHMNGWHTSS